MHVQPVGNLHRNPTTRFVTFSIRSSRFCHNTSQHYILCQPEVETEATRLSVTLSLKVQCSMTAWLAAQLRLMSISTCRSAMTMRTICMSARLLCVK